MSEKRDSPSGAGSVPYHLALMRDAMGQGGIEEGLKLARGLRVGSRDVPAGQGDVWIENSIRFSTALSAGVSKATFSVAAGAGWKAIAFDTEIWDTDAVADLGTYPTRFTINSGGLYQMHGTVVFSSGGAGVRGLAIQLNGATLLSGWSQPNQTAAIFVFVDALWRLQESDYIELVAYHDLGAALNVTDCLFSIARIP